MKQTTIKIIFINYYSFNPPINIQDLKNKITHACFLLNENQILAAINRECLRRFEACTLHDGGTLCPMGYNL